MAATIAPPMLVAAESSGGVQPIVVGLTVLGIFVVLLAVTLLLGAGRPHE